MKRWTINALRKIMLISMIAITILFATPNYAKATIEDNWGGVLLDPFVTLFAAVGDTIMQAMHFAIVGEFSTEFDWSDFSWMPMVGENDQYYGPVDGHNFPEEKEYATQIQEGSMGYRVPCIDYSPREIFAGVIPALDINFISPNHQDDDRSISSQLQTTIASWYVGLRNFSLLILMVVLVYVGIRMMLTSLAAEKAKYKQMFLDWLIAMCLIFFLHYIMSFTVTMVETLTDALATNVTDINVTVYADETEQNVETEFSTNLTGLARFRLQYGSIMAKFMYLIIYLALVIYTLMFTITYLKRVLIMAFLTLIAPLVCMTYPIDKIGDGKAQAFSFWLKEYIFNALLQPFHLLLYAVFIGSAFELATKNAIYALVALGFIFSAEKILRKMFGFEKSGTTGTLGAFAGGALVNNVLGKIGKFKGPEEAKAEEKEKANKIKPLNFRNGAYVGENTDMGMADIDAATVQGRDGRINVAGLVGGSGSTQESTVPAASQVGSSSFLDILDGVTTQSDRFTPSQSKSLGERIESLKSLDIGEKVKSFWKNPLPGGSFASGVGQVRLTAQHNAANRAKGITLKGTAKTLGKGAKFVGKSAVRLGLATGAGAAGLAAGIATGDLDKAISMGIAGAAAGNAAGETASRYAIKGANKVGKGIEANIVKPYQEGVMGVKGVKAQKEFDALNTRDNRRYIAEETRNDDGTYLSQKEIDEYVEKMFAVQQSGIYNIDEQIAAVNLQNATQAKYMKLAQAEMREEEKWINQNISAKEQAEMRAMTDKQVQELEASKEQADIQRAENIRRLRRVDNKDEYYQKAAQRAKDEAIMAASFRSQTAGMEDTEKETYIRKRFIRNGYSEAVSQKAASQVMGNIDFLDGAKKNV